MPVSIDVLSVERQTVAGREWYEMHVVAGPQLRAERRPDGRPRRGVLGHAAGCGPAHVPARPRHLSPLGMARERPVATSAERGQADLASFCNQWMVNIKHQQWDEKQNTFCPDLTLSVEE